MKTKTNTYFAIVSSNLDYFTTVWNFYRNEQVKTNLIVQPVTTNRYVNTSSAGSMSKELDWKSLEDGVVTLTLTIVLIKFYRIELYENILMVWNVINVYKWSMCSSNGIVE